MKTVIIPIRAKKVIFSGFELKINQIPKARVRSASVMRNTVSQTIMNFRPV
jgi:hypothetical protein